MKIVNVVVEGLGVRCKEARLRYQARTGLTVEQVAEKIGGFNRSYLYKIENDKTNNGVNVETLNRMEELYEEKLWNEPSIKVYEQNK